MFRFRFLLLTLPVIALGCSEPGASPESSSTSAADADPDPAKPEPPKPPPSPILTAVYRGDVATRLLASGAAKPAHPPPPAPEPAAPAAEAPEARLASAAGPETPPTAPPAAAPESEPPEAPAAPPHALVNGPKVPATPLERADDEVWLLPAPPTELVWRHPAPAAGLQVEILELRGRAWPTRVRVESDGDRRVATVIPLEPLVPGTDLRLVARVVAADGQSLLWTEPLRVKPQD